MIKVKDKPFHLLRPRFIHIALITLLKKLNSLSYKPTRIIYMYFFKNGNEVSNKSDRIRKTDWEKSTLHLINS